MVYYEAFNSKGEVAIGRIIFESESYKWPKSAWAVCAAKFMTYHQ